MSVAQPPPPPSGAPDPEPRPHAVPLNRSEERRLSGLEHELRSSDPDLDSEMSALNPAGRAGPAAVREVADHGRTDRILQAVAIAVIVLVLVPREWLGAVLSIGLLLGVPLAMTMVAVKARRDTDDADGGDPGPDGGSRRDP